MTKISAALFVFAVALVAHFGCGNAQFEGLQLAGASGIYGENETTWYFCHEVPTAWYNYRYHLGFGFGNIVARPEGGWRAQGVWVECGTIGGEVIIFLPNGTVYDEWWVETPGDALGEPDSPLVLEKSNDTLPTAEQCFWLNKNVSVDRYGGINGHWQKSSGNSLDICTVGNKYARAAYNETNSGTNYAGYISGANLLNIVFTGTFTEVKQLGLGCLQGCELAKLGGDGSVLFEHFWCSLSPSDTIDEVYNQYKRSDNTTMPEMTAQQEAISANETSTCYFAALPTFGWTTMQLANSTFP